MRRLVALLPLLAAGRIHHLVIKNDPRPVFSIESFGFQKDGKVEIRVHDVSVHPSNVNHTMGFLLFPSTNDASTNAVVDGLAESKNCVLGAHSDEIMVMDISSRSTWGKDAEPLAATSNGNGQYDLLFQHCSPQPSTVSFTLEATFVNPGPNYLSAGETPLPWVFGAECILFFAAGVVWIWWLRGHKEEAHRIHHLMTLVVVLKVTTLLFESVMYHYIALMGHSTGWNIVYYITTFIRGLVMIVVVALIGTGWSLLKPFLTEREKRIILIALAFQVVNNIAIIVVDEMAPGSIAFDQWIYVLHIADLVAFAVVLCPILWSIKNLRQAHEADSADEKTRDTLARLTQFRAFYIGTLVFIYFTRLIVVILEQGMPYDRTWVGPFFEESATLVYFAVVGYAFRPAADNNEYLQVPTEDDGIVPAHGAIEAPGAKAPSGPEDGSTSSASTRVAAPRQTVGKAAAADVETGGKPPAPAPAPAAPTKAITISGERADGDEFGLDAEDSDDDFDIGMGAHAVKAASRAPKQVRKE